MPETATDRWHNDFVFGILGILLGCFVTLVLTPDAVDSLRKLAMGTWIVVAGACLLAWVGGHFSDFPMRRFVQLAAGFVMVVALTGILMSTM